MLANEEKTPSVNEPSIPNQRKEVYKLGDHC